MNLLKSLNIKDKSFFILSIARKRYAFFVSLAFCALIVYLHRFQSYWILGIVALTMLYPIALTFSILIRKLSAMVEKQKLSLASFIVFICSLSILYFLIIDELTFHYIFWFFVLVVWMGLCFLFNQKKPYLSAFAVINILLFFVASFHIARIELLSLHYIRFKYQLAQYEKILKIKQMQWYYDKKSGIYTYSDGYNKRKMIQVNPEPGMFFHDNNSASLSMDYPAPGLFLTSVSSSKSDPFANPSLVIFKIEKQKDNKIMARFFEKNYNVFMLRKQQGSIKNPKFSGKLVFDEIPDVELTGVSVRYFDTVYEKNMQVGLFLKKNRGHAFALMTIEEAPIGFPMSPVIMKQIAQIFSKTI